MSVFINDLNTNLGKFYKLISESFDSELKTIIKNNDEIKNLNNLLHYFFKYKNINSKFKQFKKPRKIYSLFDFDSLSLERNNRIENNYYTPQVSKFHPRDINKNAEEIDNLDNNKEIEYIQDILLITKENINKELLTSENKVEYNLCEF